MNILNFGSLNIDLVYQVEHIAPPRRDHRQFRPTKSLPAAKAPTNQRPLPALARASFTLAKSGQTGNGWSINWLDWAWMCSTSASAMSLPATPLSKLTAKAKTVLSSLPGPMPK